MWIMGCSLVFPFFPVLWWRLRWVFFLRYLLLHIWFDLATLEQLFTIHYHRVIGSPQRDLGWSRGRTEGRCSKLSSSVCVTVSTLVIPSAGVMLSWSLFCSTNLSTNGMQAETIRQYSSWNYPKSLVQFERGTFQYTNNTQCAEVESMTHPTVFPWCERFMQWPWCSSSCVMHFAAFPICHSVWVR